MVPVIKDIIRLPKDLPEPLGTTKGKRSKPRSKRESQAPEPQVVIYNPEEGWDDATDPHGIVLDYVHREEVQRRKFYLFLHWAKSKIIIMTTRYRCRVYVEDDYSQARRGQQFLIPEDLWGR